MSSYKYKIDQQALQHFFLTDKPTKQDLKAVKMVVLTVVIKHFAKYIRMFEELHSLAILSLLEKKPRYDVSKSAYNYAYTICRNDIGNFLRKRREVIVEDILPLSNVSSSYTITALPPELNKFKDYLTGEKKFEIIDLSEREAINLSIFCEINNPSRKVTPPSFIPKNENTLSLLYRLLLKI